MQIFDKIKIVYEDESVLAIDKPSGLVVHTDERTVEVSLCDWLDMHFASLRDIGRPHTLDNERYVPRYGMLNRLDRGTSGLILIAKDTITFNFLSEQFESRKIEKAYMAILKGELPGETGQIYKIDMPIGRSRVDPRKWTSKDDIRNTKREAITNYEILEVIEVRENKFTKVKVYPRTGRTHQIRVHFDYLGYPLLGDDRYGEAVNESLGMEDRMYLHALSLKFKNIKGDEVSVESEVNIFNI